MGGNHRSVGLVLATRAPFPAIGGAEKRTLRLIETMQRAGAEPYLLLTEPIPADVRDQLAARGVFVETVEHGQATLRDRAGQHLRRRPSPYLSGVAERLAELVDEHRPAFVQFEHTQNAYYFDAVNGVPVVLSLHNVDSDMIATLARGEPLLSVSRMRLENRWRAMRTTERRAAASADAVLCVSAEDLREFSSRARRGVLVPNGVDEELFEIDPALPEDDLVLFVARYDYEPNSLGISAFLREGWPLVIERRPAARLKLVGPAMSAELEDLVGRTEGVEASGPVADLGPELRSAAVSVVPIWHGAGTRLKVLEAMAAARPVAGTPLGVSGIGFVGGRDGLVGDSPLEVGEAVSRLLEDRALAARVAAAGRRLAEPFRWARATAPAQALYEELIGTRRS